MDTYPDLPLHVLIVDDDVDTGDSLSWLLHSWGHDTSVARDGPSALELARRYQPDIVFLDIGLPVMNGYEVARRLCKQKELWERERRQQPLLVSLTGYGTEKDRRLALESGCDLHWTKPVEPENLKQLLTFWKYYLNHIHLKQTLKPAMLLKSKWSHR